MKQPDIDPECFDRTDLVYVEDDLNTLPHDIIFHRLHFLACHQNTVAIRDTDRSLEISYGQLLSDIVTAKNLVLSKLHISTLEQLRADKEVSFLILARGYEFVVSFFTVLAIGGIAAPTSPHVTLAEALHFMKTSKGQAVLHSRDFEALAAEISHSSEVYSECRHVCIDSHPDVRLLNPRKIRFSMKKIPDVNNPGAIIFTSGSTGKPKGAAMRRYNILVHALLLMWKNNINKAYTILQMLPTHHAAGLVQNTLPTLMGGGTVEFTLPRFDAAAIWERIRREGIQSISAVPTIYVRLLSHFENVLSKLDSAEKEIYRSAMSKVGQFQCGTSSLPTSVAARWEELFERRILERYGGTEFGNPYANYAGSKFVLGSAGMRNPGIESYLENGDHGEIFARSPLMFSKYINNVEGTRDSLTAEGYFKTGDIAERVEDHYFIKGRKSVDILKTGGYKVSALDIEHAMTNHPKIAEAIVVGVDDDEFGQRVAAAVVLKEGYHELSLSELRRDLQKSLSNYKLPSILRVVPELQKTANMKIPKQLLKKELFDSKHPDIETWQFSKPKI
ncbi:hypothetical protein LTR84_005762 [Exophiala bonariae]|uniref:AMP-dependent synthetase/ligase domain-containing protein n=1 Tax=Exophiala bonariae TaxID=1690606 RepID=A0AAV9N377_9EURO|nr:hypothetical protein LTR84_005762 [Exophiala bonariae]